MLPTSSSLVSALEIDGSAKSIASTKEGTSGTPPPSTPMSRVSSDTLVFPR
jgi:hypothetical protein